MRASPAFHARVERFGAWRAAIAALLVIAGAALVAWLASRDEFTPLSVRLAVAVLGVAVLLAAARAMRCRALDLHWDGQAWQVRHAHPTGGAPMAGRIAVALDLGAWMLLKFDRRDVPRHRRTVWIPVQRRGLEAQWHALRCAVYCARSARGHDAGSSPAIRTESQE